MKTQLIQFYEKYGFRTFGEAFSHYWLTEYSMPNLLNFSSVGWGKDFLLKELMSGNSDPHTIFRNQYFEILSKNGYRLNVISPHQYLDYCSESPVPLNHCDKVPPLSLQHIAAIDMSVLDKLRVLFTDYSELSSIYDGVRTLYRKIQPKFSGDGVHGSLFSWELKKTADVITYFDVLDKLEKNIQRLPVGHVLFMHLLLPHDPFIVQANCSMNPSIYDWKTAHRASWRHLPDPFPNTAELRERSYRQYFEQIECLYSKLEKIFQKMEEVGMFKDSIVILHGDHGGRILNIMPYPWNADKLTDQDIKDIYSTLFAVRTPEATVGYDNTPMCVEQLLAEICIRKRMGVRKPSCSRPQSFRVFKGLCQRKICSL